MSSTAAGDVLAVELKSGAVRWRTRDVPPGVEGTRHGDPDLTPDLLIVPWRTGVVDALDPATGERQWRADLDDILNTSVVAVSGEVLVGSSDGMLHSLDASDGSPVELIRLGDAAYGDLVVADPCLLVLFSRSAGANESASHVIACVDPESRETQWTFDSPTEWSTHRPLVWQGEVIVGREGQLVGLDLDDGSLRWEFPIEGTPRGLGASNRHLYVGTLSGRIDALPWGSP